MGNWYFKPQSNHIMEKQGLNSVEIFHCLELLSSFWKTRYIFIHLFSHTFYLWKMSIQPNITWQKNTNNIFKDTKIFLRILFLISLILLFIIFMRVFFPNRIDKYKLEAVYCDSFIFYYYIPRSCFLMVGHSKWRF